MITFGSSPKPSQEMKIGANAIFGTISRLTSVGYTVRRSIPENAIASPSGSANTIATA